MSAPGEARCMVSVPGRVFLELLCVTAQLGVCHSVLADALTLVQLAPGLGDEQVRAALVALGHRAACLLEGGPLPITPR